MALFVLSLCPFDISVGVGAFVIGLGQISSFLSVYLVSLPLIDANNPCAITPRTIDYLGGKQYHTGGGEFLLRF